MPQSLTRRQKLVLAALSAEPGAEFAPVQVQKLFFLLDQQVAGPMGGKLFSFEPYDYGPFDKAVYQELDFLQSKNLVEIRQAGAGPGGRRYKLTLEGQRLGEGAFTALSESLQKFIKDVSSWVRRLSFAQLVGSIYKAYPEMKARSIFVDQ